MTAGTDPQSQVLTGPQVLGLAVWFGLATGCMEVLARGVQHFLLHSPIYVSYQMAWMAPAVDVLLFLLAGVLLLGIARLVRRQVGLRTGLVVFSVLMFLGPLLNFPRIHWAAGLVLFLGLAVQGARWLVPRLARFRRLAIRAGVVMAVAVALVGVAMNVSAAVTERRAVANLPDAPAGAPNVILLILDTVRAANLSLYGYHRPTTPNLERLAAAGVVFDRAMSTAPWTLPSHGSMFTGRDAHELAANWRAPLSYRYPTLSEMLAAHGYLTGGFVGNLRYGQREFGLNRGFQRYEDFPISVETAITSSWLVRYTVAHVREWFGERERIVAKPAARVVDGFLAWLADVPARTGRPFFAFINLMDAHSPYVSPPPFDTLFGADAYTPLQLDGWTADELSAAVAAYDAAITYVDHEVGRLVDTLQARRLLANTLLVIASDHGEHWGEQELLGHANSLYMPLLHVPLLLAGPGVGPAGTRITRSVTLADLPATIFAVAGLAVPPCVPGRSLLAPPDGAARPIVAEVRKTINMPARFPASKGDLHAVIAEPWHQIENPDGSVEVFDYVADPLEAGMPVTEAGPTSDTLSGILRRALATPDGEDCGG